MKYVDITPNRNDIRCAYMTYMNESSEIAGDGFIIFKYGKVIGDEI